MSKLFDNIEDIVGSPDNEDLWVHLKCNPVPLGIDEAERLESLRQLVSEVLNEGCTINQRNSNEYQVYFTSDLCLHLFDGYSLNKIDPNLYHFVATKDQIEQTRKDIRNLLYSQLIEK